MGGGSREPELAEDVAEDCRCLPRPLTGDVETWTSEIDNKNAGSVLLYLWSEVQPASSGAPDQMKTGHIHETGKVEMDASTPCTRPRSSADDGPGAFSGA